MADLTPEALAAELYAARNAAILKAGIRWDHVPWDALPGELREGWLAVAQAAMARLAPAHAALAAERDQLAAKLAHALAANQRWAETLADLAPVRRQQTAPTAATRREGGRDHRAQS